ncbi:hypothetical protein [Caloramator sp. Dgby_cultured_2]|uniref:hypothetical protein n=1 Tax=Caloramator sp. Dgby_cultured_2 TaxID=3029174 RepID=UPI00237E5F9B|nr:hypothetical protein [Caloramator sp. Dgby_cultured_2]WDU82263.1 hypothetical protein PWK10_11190 [Caloramator sp. Dgby_cultured_2]
MGYRSFGDFTLLRKSTAKQLKRKMRKLKQKIDKGETLNFSDKCSINSYLGWLKWCNSYRLRQKYIEPLLSNGK